MTLSRTIARPMIAATFLVGATEALRNAPQLAGKASGVIETLVPVVKRVNAVIQLAAAGALATGRAPRIASATLAASLVPTTLAGHRFWEESDPAQRKAQLLHFLKNTSTLGGLILASVDTEGKPGVAWRAKRAAKDVRREARRATRAAKQEARVAAAKLG